MLHRPVVNTGAALLEAHPNPASDRLEVVTRLPKEENDASLMFIDSQGQELKRTPVPPGVQIQEWNTEGYAPGVYRLTLYGRRGVLDGRTIEIVR